MHENFDDAGQAKGLEIWRIENFEPIPYPQRDYGKFFTGDAYIVLNTKSDNNVRLSWELHFWLGKEASQDERGAAALYTIQLDDRLGGAATQHRETQNYESELFLSYFKNGIRYQEGGVDSGFNQVETNAQGEKRLFQVKGTKNIRVKQVDLSVSVMNRGDCFILDNGRDIYVYLAIDAKSMEKIKAISAANQIRDQDHNGRASVHIIDEFSSEEDQEEFFEILGSGSPSTVPDESVDEDDESVEDSDAAEVVLYKISGDAGSLQFDSIGTKPLRQNLLSTAESYILDTGSGIYVWIGSDTSPEEKSQTNNRANEFLASKDYPSWTQVHRIKEGSETTPFKQYFSAWRDRGTAHSRLIRAANDDDSESGVETEVDAVAFQAIKKSGGRAMGFMPDSGKGEVEVWRIENADLASVDPDKYGFFFGGDSYVIQYEYKNRRGEQGTVIYYWQGKQSSIEDKAAAANHAVRLDNELGGAAIQVRVTQGYEPRHFLKVFKGKLILFTGGHASGFENIHDHETYDADGVRLFRIRGTCADDVRADQLPENASSLASDDAFVLETPGVTYVWYGKGCPAFAHEMAESVIERLSPDHEIQTVNEGEEPAEFWDALGGEGDYDQDVDSPGAPVLDPRLFHCRIRRRNRIRIQEVGDFTQEDLEQDNIMVLDGGDEVYVWEGSGSTEKEKERAIDMAKRYIRTDPTDRSEDTVPIVRIHQGKEPRSFKRLFPSWDDNLWESIPTYEDYNNRVREANALIEADGE